METVYKIIYYFFIILNIYIGLWSFFGQQPEYKASDILRNSLKSLSFLAQLLCHYISTIFEMKKMLELCEISKIPELGQVH